jgi:hypothetical protein
MSCSLECEMCKAEPLKRFRAFSVAKSPIRPHCLLMYQHLESRADKQVLKSPHLEMFFDDLQRKNSTVVLNTVLEEFILFQIPL